ncbi:hypothetical protein [Paraburkholderia sp. A1RO-5L]|uniref:hypothetical protein n=1 Tax=unclassified Paraburkholderia TaxID=2615204 RepID=UPI003B80744B
MNIKALSEVFRARTHSARLQAAWLAAIDMVANPNIANRPSTEVAHRMILSHAQHGPRATRLSSLEVWRIVVDAQHSLESRVAHV